MRVGYIPVHVELSMPTVDDTEVSQYKYCISGNDLESTFIDFSVNIWRLGSYEDSMFVYGTSRAQYAHF